MKPLSIECPNLTCIINQSWPGCTVTLVKNTVRLIGNIQKWPFTADFLTHVQRIWNCSFTIIQTNRIFFSIFRIELNLRGDNGVIRVLPKTWNRVFQILQEAKLNSIQLRIFFTVIPCTKLCTWRLLIVGCYYFFDKFFLFTTLSWIFFTK